MPPDFPWAGVWSDSGANKNESHGLRRVGERRRHGGRGGRHRPSARGGAGPVAASAGARGGRRTVLFERHGFLGGAATAGAVGQFVGWETRAGRRVIAGIAKEIGD